MIFTPAQEDLFVGHMLGDGCVPKFASSSGLRRFSFGQMEARKDWVEYSHNVLNPFTEKTRVRRIVHKKNGKGYKKHEYATYCYYTSVHEIFSQAREDWYMHPDCSNSQKIVPKDIFLNWNRLAVWFADDGTNWQPKKWAMLHSQSFSKEDNEFLVFLLMRDLDIHATLNKRKNNKWVIRINTPEYFRFIDGIKPYLSTIKSLSAKIDTSVACTKPAKSEFVHSNETKSLAMSMHLNGVSKQEIAKRLNVHRKTVAKWVGRTNRSSMKLDGKNQECMRLWETRNFSKASIARMLGVHRSTVNRWTRDLS